MAKIEMLSWEEAMLKRHYPEAWARRQPPNNPPLWIAHSVKLAVDKCMGDCWREVGRLPEQWSWAATREARLMFSFSVRRDLAPFYDGRGLQIDFTGN
jgi:hypothetical protein